MIKFIDLFSGIGGFRLAFEEADAECVMSSEIDKFARETYYLNFNQYPEGDLKEISSDNIPNFNVLCAGFPCQPFSIGGHRKGFEDARGTLFFEILRVLKDKQPEAFLLENVSGITSQDNGRTLEVIEESLDELGYNFKWQLINAKDYGIPQNRNRWYCVGFRKDLDASFQETDLESYFKFPEPRKLEYTFFDIIDKDLESDYYMITETAKKNINLHIDKFKESNRYIKENEIILANEIRPSRCQFRNDGLSPCLTAKMGTGGNNVPVIVNYNRKLTERECLRLMGFPENFKIREKHYQSYKQIGNSLVLPIVSDIAHEIIRIININRSIA